MSIDHYAPGGTIFTKSPLAPGGTIYLLTLGFESGFTGFSGLQRTSSVWVSCLFVEDYLIPFFSPMCDTSARGLAMKAPFNNKLPTQTNECMVNPEIPENPDSKTIRCCARNFHRRLGCIGMICPENNFESGFTGFIGLQRTTSFWVSCLFVEDYLIPFFSPLRYASAKGLTMIAPCNNKFPTQTNDVMVNPENPDSNQFTWKLPNHIEAYYTIFVTLHHRVIPQATSYNKIYFSEDKKNPRHFCIGDSFFNQAIFLESFLFYLHIGNKSISKF